MELCPMVRARSGSGVRPMSAIEELKKEGLLTKKQLARLQKKGLEKARTLKLVRKFNDEQARRVFIAHYIKNGRKWDSKVTQKQFNHLMETRHRLHERIARLVPEKVEPD